MKTAWLVGEPPIEITIRSSTRARNYSLRVSGLDGRVTLTVPKRGNISEAMEFVHSREAWIRRTLAQQPDIVNVTIGSEIPFMGVPHRIVAAQVRSPKCIAQEILLPPDPKRVGVRLVTFLKAAARQKLHEASARHAQAVQRPLGRITLRDTRSRWGSCTAAGDLMYSWRLIMSPPEVLDYVAAHEVAHFIQMNHSPAFWAVVETLCPDYRNLRAWLKRKGTNLHRYRFDD